MATAFRRASDRYVARFEPDELTVVVMLLEQTRELLVGPVTGEATREGNPGEPAGALGGERAGERAGALGGEHAGEHAGEHGGEHGEHGKHGVEPEDEFEHLMRSAGWGEDGTPPGHTPSARASSPSADLPADPALRRLLPDPNPADAKAAAEFRRLTGSGLRERKAATIGAAVEVLSGALSATLADESAQTSRHRGEPGGRRRKRPPEVTVDLDQTQAQALMVALTDVRLVLGERLGLNTDDDAETVVNRLEHSLDPEDPLVAMAFAYDFLTWLQESLTQALLGG